MPLLLLPFPASEDAARALAGELDAEVGALVVRRFPDGESYVRIDTPVVGRSIAFVCTLRDPDRLAVPLLFAAATARELGAARIGLVAPYLAYMRQDARFRPGEAVASRQFGRLLSQGVDWLATVDPHLHRHDDLSEVYQVPTMAVRAAPAVAAWIAREVAAPVLIGPDGESAQWVEDVAARIPAPHVVLAKVRRGDRDVQVSVPDASRCRGKTPVLLDDIISTAHTMVAAIGHLRAAGLDAPVCVGVHAVFADDAHAALLAAGAARVVTCDTIPHPTNAIATAALLAPAVRTLA
jgi:ribose-phosphate pyrophosphokinase